MTCDKEDILEKFLEIQEELENCKDDLKKLDIWIDSLDELSEIKKAFEVDETDKLNGKTILDIGTDYVKPLYIALKYEPKKIIGINDNPYPDVEKIEQKSKLLVKTEIKFYECSFFNEEKLNEILDNETQKKSDYVLLSKTLHHLRTGECIAKDRDPEHECREDEKTCINRFDEQKIFDQLLDLGDRLIVYEYFNPGEMDDDKVRGRGGYFTLKEWERILDHLAHASDNLAKKYKVELIQPLRHSIDTIESENMNTILRQVDCICFYVEKKDK